jgi:hypothetical protein
MVNYERDAKKMFEDEREDVTARWRKLCTWSLRVCIFHQNCRQKTGRKEIS